MPFCHTCKNETRRETTGFAELQGGVVQYLPPRRDRMAPVAPIALPEEAEGEGGNRLLRWIDKVLSR